MSRTIMKSVIYTPASLRVVLHAVFDADSLKEYTVTRQHPFDPHSILELDCEEEVEHFAVDDQVPNHVAYESAAARFREIVLPLV